MPPPRPKADAPTPLSLREQLFADAVNVGHARLTFEREPGADDRRKVIAAALKWAAEGVAAFEREFPGAGK